jgi:hypothetical protein
MKNTPLYNIPHDRLIKKRVTQVFFICGQDENAKTDGGISGTFQFKIQDSGPVSASDTGARACRFLGSPGDHRPHGQ